MTARKNGRDLDQSTGFVLAASMLKLAGQIGEGHGRKCHGVVEG
jgi:hypothetical protein